MAVLMRASGGLHGAAHLRPQCWVETGEDPEDFKVIPGCTVSSRPAWATEVSLVSDKTNPNNIWQKLKSTSTLRSVCILQAPEEARDSPANPELRLEQFTIKRNSLRYLLDPLCPMIAWKASLQYPHGEMWKSCLWCISMYTHLQWSLVCFIW